MGQPEAREQICNVVFARREAQFYAGGERYVRDVVEQRAENAVHSRSVHAVRAQSEFCGDISGTHYRLLLQGRVYRNGYRLAEQTAVESDRAVEYAQIGGQVEQIVRKVYLSSRSGGKHAFEQFDRQRQPYIGIFESERAEKLTYPRRFRGGQLFSARVARESQRSLSVRGAAEQSAQYLAQIQSAQIAQRVAYRGGDIVYQRDFGQPDTHQSHAREIHEQFPFIKIYTYQYVAAVHDFRHQRYFGGGRIHLPLHTQTKLFRESLRADVYGHGQLRVFGNGAQYRIDRFGQSVAALFERRVYRYVERSREQRIGESFEKIGISLPEALHSRGKFFFQRAVQRFVAYDRVRAVERKLYAHIGRLAVRLRQQIALRAQTDPEAVFRLARAQSHGHPVERRQSLYDGLGGAALQEFSEKRGYHAHGNGSFELSFGINERHGIGRGGRKRSARPLLRRLHGGGAQKSVESVFQRIVDKRTQVEVFRSEHGQSQSEQFKSARVDIKITFVDVQSEESFSLTEQHGILPARDRAETDIPSGFQCERYHAVRAVVSRYRGGKFDIESQRRLSEYQRYGSVLGQTQRPEIDEFSHKFENVVFAGGEVGAQRRLDGQPFEQSEQIFLYVLRVGEINESVARKFVRIFLRERGQIVAAVPRNAQAVEFALQPALGGGTVGGQSLAESPDQSGSERQILRVRVRLRYRERHVQHEFVVTDGNGDVRTATENIDGRVRGEEIDLCPQSGEYARHQLRVESRAYHEPVYADSAEQRKHDIRRILCRRLLRIGRVRRLRIGSRARIVARGSPRQYAGEYLGQIRSLYPVDSLFHRLGDRGRDSGISQYEIAYTAHGRHYVLAVDTCRNERRTVIPVAGIQSHRISVGSLVESDFEFQVYIVQGQSHVRAVRQIFRQKSFYVRAYIGALLRGQRKPRRNGHLTDVIEQQTHQIGARVGKPRSLFGDCRAYLRLQARDARPHVVRRDIQSQRRAQSVVFSRSRYRRSRIYGNTVLAYPHAELSFKPLGQGEFHSERVQHGGDRLKRKLRLQTFGIENNGGALRRKQRIRAQRSRRAVGVHESERRGGISAPEQSVRVDGKIRIHRGIKRGDEFACRKVCRGSRQSRSEQLYPRKIQPQFVGHRVYADQFACVRKDRASDLDGRIKDQFRLRGKSVRDRIHGHVRRQNGVDDDIFFERPHRRRRALKPEKR